jgi:hypothetical protein
MRDLCHPLNSCGAQAVPSQLDISGSCSLRHLLDDVIILNERHLKRLMPSYLVYYRQDRTHLGLAKDTPAGRPTEIRCASEGKIQSFPRLGGLHHRYAVAA